MDRLPILFLDFGHGGIWPNGDSGAIGEDMGPSDKDGHPTDRYEKDDNLRFGLAVLKALEEYPIDIRTTRTTDEFVTNEYGRAVLANEAGADYFISIHRNAFTNPTAKGLSVWIHTDSGTETLKKATTIFDKLCAVDDRIYKRGVNRGYSSGIPGQEFAVNRYTNMPSCLVEILFITNPDDNDIYDSRFGALVTAFCEAIGDIFGFEYRKENPPTGGTGSQEHPWVVYLARPLEIFADEADADECIRRVKEAYPDARVYKEEFKG